MLKTLNPTPLRFLTHSCPLSRISFQVTCKIDIKSLINCFSIIFVNAHLQEAYNVNSKLTVLVTVVMIEQTLLRGDLYPLGKHCPFSEN